RDAPHLLILDEPTNHLDVDAREALVQALNDYAGAVILISHDRHMVELTADRLVLVDGGTAKDYPGSIEDYIDFVLGRNQPKADAGKGATSKPKGGAKSREEMKALQKAVSEAEAAVGKAEARLAAIDAAMAGSGKPAADLAGLGMAELGRQRREVADQLEAAEARWMEAGEALDAFMN
ncbi:MAG: ABC transporter ATP-binding protein, partial [Novosphingobium sp.]|nr:ABC transporter ATP-binding protein [Novosphingobium sp.]